MIINKYMKLEKLKCIFFGHKTTFVYRARYNVSTWCLRCKKNVYTEKQAERQRIKLLKQKYGMFEYSKYL